MRCLDDGELQGVAKKYAALIAASRRTERGRSVGVTASVGTALVRRGDTQESLLSRADDALYEDKRGKPARTVGP